MFHHRFLPWVLAVGCFAPIEVAAGRQLEACARGNIQACYEMLSRPRLDPGRRAAIVFHLDEIEALRKACERGEMPACSTLAQRLPDLPPELQVKRDGPPAAPSD